MSGDLRNANYKFDDEFIIILMLKTNNIIDNCMHEVDLTMYVVHNPLHMNTMVLIAIPMKCIINVFHDSPHEPQ